MRIWEDDKEERGKEKMLPFRARGVCCCSHPTSHELEAKRKRSSSTLLSIGLPTPQ